MQFTRRSCLSWGFLQGFFVLSLASLSSTQAAVPGSNPVAHLKITWTDSVRWQNVVSIADFPGATIEARIAAAQAALQKKGGGVLYFPAGTYRFTESVAVAGGVVWRGANPEGITDARDERYTLPTQFEFPKYVPKLEGAGTPKNTAFKRIGLESPETASNCGLVNIAINRGHVLFPAGGPKTAGRNRLVYGCTLRNAADVHPDIPNKEMGQHPWQRFPRAHQGAIAVSAAENLLIANNRIPKSGEDNFLMPGYLVKGRKGELTNYVDGVLFDYDYRYGIIANFHCIGGGGGAMPIGTPELYPAGFIKGIVIQGNYIFCTGRAAIEFCGDGTICSSNVIRFAKGVVRPSHTGLHLSTGSSTTDTRAIEMRGWRWTLEGNDYEVYRNLCSDRRYYINDGEGIMHEGHCNSAVVDSRVVGNKGNAYISIFHTGGVDNLLVEGNDIRPDLKIASSIAAIYVVADRNKQPFPCRNVRIVNNVTGGTGIQVGGTPGEGNVIAGNRSVSEKGKIINRANAVEDNNTGYQAAR